MTTIYESVANTDLARILQGMAGAATVEPEPTDVFPGGNRPDLLITAPGRSPVAVEARRHPAANLERDAAARFALNAAEYAARHPSACSPLKKYSADTRQAVTTVPNHPIGLAGHRQLPCPPGGG